VVVGHTRVFIALSALLGLGVACQGGPWYHVETFSLPCGVEIKSYFQCGDADCSNYSPSESFQILSAWGNDFRYEPDDGEIEAVFVVSGRLFVLAFNDYGEFVMAVNQDGRLVPLCDLTECWLGVSVESVRLWRDGRDLIVVMDTQGQCGIPKGQLYRRRVPAVFVPRDARLLVSPDGDVNCPPVAYEKSIHRESGDTNGGASQAGPPSVDEGSSTSARQPSDDGEHEGKQQVERPDGD